MDSLAKGWMSYFIRLFSKLTFFWLLTPLLLASNAHAHIPIDSKTYDDAGKFAKKLGMKANWHKMGEEMELSGGQATIKFKGDKRDVFISGTKIWLGNATRVKGSSLYIYKKDVENTLLPILKPQTIKNNLKVTRIVIDPGHGGNDFGAENKELNIKEKDLTLDVAKRLQSILIEDGYQADLTRTKDNFLENRARAEVANQKKADLLVSIHFNAAGVPEAKGIETFALSNTGQPSTGQKLENEDHETFPGNNQDAANTLLAYCVQSTLHSELQMQDRGVKRARFKILKWLNCPGILIEGGFITNPQESQMLTDPLYRQNLAKTIALGIKKYHKTLDWVASEQGKR